MLILDQPPQLILPDHWQAKRPAIIRPNDLPSIEEQAHIPVGFFSAGAPVELIDEGDSVSSSGAGTNTHTWSAVSGAGPHCAVAVYWRHTAARTLSTLTWNGVGGTILVQQTNGSSTVIACAIVIFPPGARSGNLVAVFSNTVLTAVTTRVSLVNLKSTTAIDTATGNPNTLVLASPGSNGIRFAAYANETTGTAVTWTNATEIADASLGSMRISAAYDLGDDANNIVSASATAVSRMTVGVSLR